MPKKTVLVLRTCDENMKSYGGFIWPEKGKVSAPDWNSKPECGNGLHGLLWGEGDGSLISFDETAKALIVKVPAESIVDLHDKVKFPAGTVVFCGQLKDAAGYLKANGGTGKAIVSGTATAGDYGTATAGVSGTATAGVRGTATAGDRGTIAIEFWSGKRYKMKIATVKDEDGDGELEPNTPYKLNEKGEFVKANA